MLNVLQLSLYDRRNQDKRQLALRLCAEIWNVTAGITNNVALSYLDFYDAKVNVLDTGKVHLRTHQDVIAVISWLKQHKQKTMEALQTELLSQCPRPSWMKVLNADVASHLLGFASSLWLFLDTSDWQSTETLAAFAQRSTGGPYGNAVCDDRELTMNGRALSQIAGFDIRWTSRMQDHLLLKTGAIGCPQLYLFAHASYLSSETDSGERDVLPRGFKRETAETLALLFPCGVSSRNRWDNRVRRRNDIDVEKGVSCTTDRTAARYHFWRERLLILQGALDSSRPKTLRQWFHDRRDSEKYFTFWYAVIAIALTLLFGLIQSITGIIQVAQR